MATQSELPDILDKQCGARQVLDLLGEKWTPLLIYALSSGTRRSGELGRAIPGISPKMLTQTLRHLERDGLVARHVYPQVPPRVEYSLTPLGCAFLVPIKVLCQWAEGHQELLTEVRVRRAKARH